MLRGAFENGFDLVRENIRTSNGDAQIGSSIGQTYDIDPPEMWQDNSDNQWSIK